MRMEIRPAGPEEMKEARRVAAESIVLPPGIIPKEFIDGITHDMTLCAFVNGKLATSYAAWPFTMKFNGMDAPVAGVSFVGTLPVFRRMGCLRKVHEKHFELLHERGERAISILFASKAAIYQRYGYALASTQNAYDIEPGHIQFRSLKHLNSSGKLKQLHENKVETLDKIYNRFISRRTGYLLRDKFKWETGVLSPPPSPGTVHDVILYEENGVPLGYVIYSVESHFKDHGLDQVLSIKDMAWLSIPAYYGLWHYFTKMDLTNNIHWRNVPCDDPMPHLLLEPAGLNLKSMNGFLGRIIDVEKAIPLRGYSEDGELTFEIVGDDMCPWNNGKWQVEISNGKGSIKRTEKGPEITTTINSLGMLLFGQISATRAMRMGRLDAAREDAIAKYDRLLITEYKPFCADLI